MTLSETRDVYFVWLGPDRSGRARLMEFDHYQHCWVTPMLVAEMPNLSASQEIYPRANLLISD